MPLYFIRAPLVCIALAVCLGPAWAECIFCHPSVRLDETLATCLTERLDEEIAKLQTVSYTTVNLAECYGSEGNRGGLPILSSPGSDDEPLDVTFLLDEAGLRCLVSQLATVERPIEPSRVFQIAGNCQ